nr:MAG TPA: hypothetical protein [Caudoviricetes sp.]
MILRSIYSPSFLWGNTILSHILTKRKKITKIS